MASKTDEEFKNLLKTLIQEKRQQEDVPDQSWKKKFEQKLTVSHQNALFKELLEAKEKECVELREKLEKVKPVLKRLTDDLKAKEEAPQLSEELFLLQEKLEEEEKRALSKEQAMLLEKGALEETLRELTETIEAKEQLFAGEKEAFIQVVQKLEAEVALLMGRLAEGSFRQEDQQEEQLTAAYNELKELSKKHALKVEELADKETKLSILTEELLLAQTLTSGLKNEIDEKEGEIRKAQLHLAKKIKENALLTDLIERQKMQEGELKSALAVHKAEMDRIQNSMHLQRLHDEKQDFYVKEKEEVLHAQMKEWQEKYMQLYTDWQAIKKENLALVRYKRNFEQAASTLSTMKNLLQQTEIHPEEESPS